MKHIVLLVTIWTITTSSLAQPKTVALEYNDAAFIRNFNLTYHHAFLNDAFSLYAGIGYHLNNNLYLAKIVPTVNGTIEERAAFYAMETNTFFLRLGVRFGVEKTIKIPSPNANLFVFYDFQYYNPDITGGQYGRDIYGNIVGETPIPASFGVGPDTYIQHVGSGLKANVYKNIYLKLFASLGAYKLKAEEGNFVWYGYENYPKAWQFSRMFGVGVEYSLFKKKEAKEKK